MNHEKLIENFAEQKILRGHSYPEQTYGYLFYEKDVLYSYGRHFPLAIKMPEKSGIGFLINGDRYSILTTRHQSLAISCLENNVQIPFSALRPIFRHGNLISNLQKLVFLATDIGTFRNVKYRDRETGKIKVRREHLLGSNLFKFYDKVQKKTRYFLSSADNGAKHWNGGYFCVELPGKAETVHEAYGLLEPPEVYNQPFVRQGEFFFVPHPEIKFKKSEIIKRTIERTIAGEERFWVFVRKDYDGEIARISDFETAEKAIEYANKLIENGKIRAEIIEEFNLVEVWRDWTTSSEIDNRKNVNLSNIFGNGGNPHHVTQLAYVGKGRIGHGKRVFVRGTVRHPEHKMVTFGNVWHEVFINTAKNSWNADGYID